MEAPVYSEDLKIKDALPIYFSNYHFSEEGYHHKYFRLKLGSFYIPFPNTKSRIKGVKFHDIHHILTEYTAFWKGETEIGAWEIASGCGHILIGWFLNFGSFGIGLFLYPKAVFKAFMKGRHVKTNLYYGYKYDEILLNSTVGELRKELGIGILKKNKASDILYFLFWVLLVILEISVFAFIFCFALSHII